MSDDIMKRLRLSPVLMYSDQLGQSRIDYEACKKYINNEGVKMMREAADEIERLRKENDDLKEIVALQGEVVRMAQSRHEERDEAMVLIETIARDVSILSSRPANIIKFSDLVDHINEWGDAARKILDKKEIQDGS